MASEIEIKNLNEINKNNKQQVVYRKDNIATDFTTNEITERNQVIVRKVQTRESFIKLFTENIHYLVKLEPQEKILFFTLLSSVDYKNIVRFDKSMKQNIILDKVLSRAGMYRALNGLIEKKLLYKVDRDFIKAYAGVGSDECYLFNANLVGRGTWNDLKSLRHTITKEWDFENLEVKQSLEVKEKYIGLDDIRKEQDQYQIKEVIENHNEITKTKNIEVIVEKKETPALTESTLFDENKNEKEAKSFIEEFAGMFNNAFHPTKTAKEMKREKLDKDLEEGRI